MKPIRFLAASTRYAPAVEPKALAPAGAVVDAETVEFDEDGRRILTSPLAAPARPVPTVMPPPVRPMPKPPQASGSRLPPGTKFPPVTKETAENARATWAQKPAPAVVRPNSRTFDGRPTTISPDEIPY